MQAMAVDWKGSRVKWGYSLAIAPVHLGDSIVPAAAAEAGLAGAAAEREGGEQLPLP